MAVPLLRISSAAPHKIVHDPDAARPFLPSLEKCPAPVFAVNVFGMGRAGKDTFLNEVVRKMHAGGLIEGAAPAPAEARAQPFVAAGGAAPVTQGVDAAIFPRTAALGGGTWLLLSTEGFLNDESALQDALLRVPAALCNTQVAVAMDKLADSFIDTIGRVAGGFMFGAAQRAGVAESATLSPPGTKPTLTVLLNQADPDTMAEPLDKLMARFSPDGDARLNVSRGFVTSGFELCKFAKVPWSRAKAAGEADPAGADAAFAAIATDVLALARPAVLCGQHVTGAQLAERIRALVVASNAAADGGAAGADPLGIALLHLRATAAAARAALAAAAPAETPGVWRGEAVVRGECDVYRGAVLEAYDRHTAALSVAGVEGLVRAVRAELEADLAALTARLVTADRLVGEEDGEPPSRANGRLELRARLVQRHAGRVGGISHYAGRHFQVMIINRYAVDERTKRMLKNGTVLDWSEWRQTGTHDHLVAHPSDSSNANAWGFGAPPLGGNKNFGNCDGQCLAMKPYVP